MPSPRKRDHVRRNSTPRPVRLCGGDQPYSLRLTAEILEDRRMLHALTTGVGDGNVSMSVDGYGSFGTAISGTEAGAAMYDPIGPLGSASTTFESWMAIQFGNSGTRQVLSSGTFSTQPLPDVTITGSTTEAVSNFAIGALNVQLRQVVAPIFNTAGTRTGALLTQTYQLVNPSASTISFDLVRYMDGDLQFDSSLIDGGGRTISSNDEILFETDAGGTSTTSTTFLGIDSNGGTIEPGNRFQLLTFAQLRSQIIAGRPLANTIQGDINGDGFVDPGQEYDVTLGLRNTYSLTPGSSSVYVTRTVFGTGNPGDVIIQVPTVNLGSDASTFEGDSGLTDMVFPVTLSVAPTSPLTVVYSTQDVTATSPGDYVAASGTLTFQPGQPLTQYITVQVAGDLVAEANEAFQVRLSNVGSGELGRAVATGTIINDDVEVSINDVSTVEPDSGSRDAVFVITAFGVVNKPVTISYDTGDITAQAGSDYLLRHGSVVIPAGSTAVRVTIPILGDALNEPTESFLVLLTDSINARVNKGIGIGTIVDNDLVPSLYTNDVHITNVARDVLAAVFTVALDIPSGQIVTVQYATADGVAKDGFDYVGDSGTLTFYPGMTTQHVTIPVLTSPNYSPNEKFYFNLSNPTSANLGDPQGIGTLIFAEPPRNEFIIDNGDAGYSRSQNGWATLTNTLSYQMDYDYHAAGNGSGTATWNFAGIPTGTYQVFARWSAFSNRATNAPLTIYDGSTPLATVAVNQQLAPVGDSSNGIVWQSLGTYSNASGQLVVRLSDNANGYVVADAIRIVGAGGYVPQSAEIDVAGFDHSIASGDDTASLLDGTDFGAHPVATSSVNHTFVIANTGNIDLHLTGNPRVVISGDTSDFAVIAQPALTVAPGTSTTFQVMFHPTALGSRNATVTIVSDDGSESPYVFSLSGTGITGGETELTVDDGGEGFQGVGNWTSGINDRAYGGQLRTAPAGQGEAQATWTFSGLAPGEYNVYTTWSAFENRAGNAPYTLLDGATVRSTIQVNQQVAPNGPSEGDVTWQWLGTASIVSGVLRVRLNNQADGIVAADAVRIVRGSAPIAPIITHNTALPQDVNGDSRVSTLDALIVINNLNQAAASAVPLAASSFQAAPLADTAADGSERFMDVNGDGVVTPRDALMVINYLLQLSAAAGAGQALSATPQVAVADSADTSSAATNSDVSSASIATLVAVDTAIGEISAEPVLAPTVELTGDLPAEQASKAATLLIAPTTRAHATTSPKRSSSVCTDTDSADS